MSPITIGIALAIFGLQMLTNKDVVRITKQLVKNIDSSDLTGQEKTAYVMKELDMFFKEFAPIILEAVVKLVVLDMQNKNGVLQTKLNKVSENEKV